MPWPDTSQSLVLNGHTFVLAELPSESPSTPELSDFERDTLDFCQQWLTGAPSFTIHTSGSTGKPKAITHTRQQMLASAQATVQYLGLVAGMRALVCIPTRYVGGRMMLVRSLETGMRIQALDPRGNPLGRLLAKDEPPHFVAMVPMQLQQFLEETPQLAEQLATTKAIILGGAPVSPTLQSALQVLPCPVFHTYGMTETVSHVALRRLNGPEPEEDFGLLPGIEADLDDRGCLRLRGEVSDQAWVTTNDLVTWTAPGRFRWLGRADNVVNSGGVKIFTEQIENQIEALWSGTARFFLYGLPHPKLGEQLTLVVEGNIWSTEEQQALLERLRQTLPPYQAPKVITFVPTFVETPTGKVMRKQTVQLATGTTRNY